MLEAGLARSCFLRVRHDKEGNCHSVLESGLALAWFPCTSLTSRVGLALIRVFMRADALNARTRLALITTSTPVFGFLPIRWAFLRTVNVPNPGSLTVSPRTMQVVGDACGELTPVSHDLAMQRMEAAGAKPTSWIQVLLELQRDQDPA